MIKLGQKVKDKITGFEGVVISKLEYRNGCIQFCVKPRMTEEGKMPEGQYIDVENLEIVKEEEIKMDPGSGGDMPDMPKDSYSG